MSPLEVVLISRVLVAGHRRERVEVVAARYPGMVAEVVDVADPEQVMALAEHVGERWPELTTVISNAGIQHSFDFAGPVRSVPPSWGARSTSTSRVICVANAFLPLLEAEPRSRLVNVGSGLGYVPLAAAPVYSSTKAAVHSFTMALRRQLNGSTVQIVESIPPVVVTDLHRNLDAIPPRRAAPAMGLKVVNPKAS